MNRRLFQLVILLLIPLLIIVMCYQIPPLLEDYEVFLNFLVYDASQNNIAAPKVIEANFLTLGLLVELQSFFDNGVPVYGYFKLTIIVITICFLGSFFVRKSNLLKGVFFLIVLFLSVSNSLFFIQSNKIVIISFFASVISVLLIKKTFLKWFFFLLFLIIAITSRIDITLILSSLFVVISVLYFEKKIVFKAIFMFFLSASLNLYFISLVEKDHDGMKNFYKYERAIQDRNDFNGNSNLSNQNISKNDIEKIALGMFINDSKGLADMDYESILKHSSLIEYVFFNPEFISIYLDKLEVLKEEIISQAFYLFWLSMMAWVLILKFHIDNDKSLLKFSFILIVYLMIPLLINAIANVNLSFLIYYMLIPFLAFLYLSFFKQKHIKKSLFNYSCLFISILLLVFHNNFLLNTHYFDLKKGDLVKQKIMLSIKNENQKGFTPVMAYSNFQVFLPNKLNYNFSNVHFAFLDAGAYNDLSYFKFLDTKYFKDQMFIDKISTIEQKYGNLYSSPFVLKFYKYYLDKIYNHTLEDEVKEIFNENFLKTKISIVKN